MELESLSKRSTENEKKDDEQSNFIAKKPY